MFSFYTLKKEKAGFYETSVYVYQTAWPYIPEDSNLYIYYCGNFNLLKPTGHVMHQQF
jgi:hypothetical protein